MNSKNSSHFTKTNINFNNKKPESSHNIHHENCPFNQQEHDLNKIKTDRQQTNAKLITSKFPCTSNDRKQWNSPPKKIDQKIQVRSINSSKKYISYASPQSRRSKDGSGEKQRLSFKKPHQKNGSKQKQKQQVKSLTLQNQVIISLKQIKRLREIIQCLLKENKKLKRIAHEIIEDRFNEWSEFQDQQQNSYLSQRSKQKDQGSQQKQRQKFVTKNNVYLTHSLNNSSCQQEPLQFYRNQNLQLIQQIANLRQALEQIMTSKTQIIKQSNNLRESLWKYEISNKQLIQQNSNLKKESAQCYHKIFELQQKITHLERSNQRSLRFSKWTVQSRDLDASAGEEEQYSIVEHKITNNGSDQCLNKIQEAINNRESNHDSELYEEDPGYQITITQLLNDQGHKRQLKKRKNDDESIRTKESQTVTSTILATEIQPKVLLGGSRIRYLS